MKLRAGSRFFSRIIEVGLLKVEKGEVVEEYQTFLNPNQEIPEFITKMTGITEHNMLPWRRFFRKLPRIFRLGLRIQSLWHNVILTLNFLIKYAII